MNPLESAKRKELSEAYLCDHGRILIKYARIELEIAQLERSYANAREPMRTLISRQSEDNGSRA